MSFRMKSSLPLPTAGTHHASESQNKAIPADSMYNFYGRRVERDGTWTIHHVFSGIPADIGGVRMTGLSKNKVTDAMLWINASNAERRRLSRRPVEGSLPRNRFPLF